MDKVLRFSSPHPRFTGTFFGILSIMAFQNMAFVKVALPLEKRPSPAREL